MEILKSFAKSNKPDDNDERITKAIKYLGKKKLETLGNNHTSFFADNMFVLLSGELPSI